MLRRVFRPVRCQSNASFRNFASKKNAKQTVEPPNVERPRITKAMLLHELKEMLKLAVGGTALLTGLILSSGYVIETAKSWNPMSPPGNTLEIRDNDGKPITIHTMQKGSGHVTVLLDGGVGETSFDWQKVADELSSSMRVVSIDRPGLGFSSNGSEPRTAMQISQEYKQVLEKLPATNKLILVGHGAGGYNMRQLAQDLESVPNSNCIGLVLVDALQEELRSEMSSISEPVKEALEAMDKNSEMVLKLSYVGLVRVIDYVQMNKFKEKYSNIDLPYVLHFAPSPKHRGTCHHENEAISTTEETFRNQAHVLSTPSIILSHGKADMFDGMKAAPGVDGATLQALEDKWQEAQVRLAKKVGGQQWIVTDAGHSIHQDKPEAVVKAVRTLFVEGEHLEETAGAA